MGFDFRSGEVALRQAALYQGMALAVPKADRKNKGF
jgi:hypothetical protein